MNGHALLFNVREVAEPEYQVPTLDVGAIAPPTPVSPTPPEVFLTLPNEGSLYRLPDVTVNLEGHADLRGNILKKFEFVQGSTVIGRDDTLPHTLAWEPTEPGVYALRAKLTYGDDSVAFSNTRNIVVSDVASPWDDLVWVLSPKIGGESIYEGGGDGGVFSALTHALITDTGGTADLIMHGTMNLTYGSGIKHHRITFTMVNATDQFVQNQLTLRVDGGIVNPIDGLGSQALGPRNDTQNIVFDFTTNYTGTPIPIDIQYRAQHYVGNVGNGPHDRLASISGVVEALD